MTDNKTYGYATMFAYLHEFDKNSKKLTEKQLIEKNVIGLRFKPTVFSNSKFIDYCEAIIGVSSSIDDLS